MLKTSWKEKTLNLFRVIGNIESLSYVILLAIAMPLKYWMDIPEPVSFVGAAHGFLFILYAVSIIFAAIFNRWSILRIIVAFLAAFIPFGPYLVYRRIKKTS
ncbi:DUF3817 domain-containing protein [Psychrobacillus sp.]|uniref:DUF3817 domain-containing protein n=1 Tax=Psychrobacillus sp. TaxID=1871623 RepID=UPI0028BE6E3E|nr:DUF3817 domain-containing protein [Psychrobacillus sp.]